MSERSELAGLLKTAGDNNSLAFQFNLKYWGPVADELLAAGYRKPEVITIIEELVELEVGSVIRDQVGVLFLQERNGWADWHDETGDCVHVNLPATVLYAPEVTA